MSVSLAAMAVTFVSVSSFMMPRSLSMMVSCGFMVESGIAMMSSQTAFASNFSHMFTIFTDGLAALTTSLRGFLRSEFVGVARLMSSSTTASCNLSLLLRIHGGKTALIFSSHDLILLVFWGLSYLLR
jgi:hypothetical protein